QGRRQWRGPSGQRREHRAGDGKDKQMYSNEKSEKVKIKTVVFTILWFVLAAAAMLFIGFAGHV
ncbi:MAG TPA: hypothetical protein VGI66_13750, partial [Streptosporangiaceae bacterium]